MSRLLLRAIFVAGVALAAVPSIAVAKWTVMAEIGAETATAGEPTELIGRLTIDGHEAPGMVVPVYDQIERVIFRISSRESRHRMEVTAVAATDEPGLYRAAVTYPTAGEWAVALVFVRDGVEYDHTSFPHQAPHLVTVMAPAAGWLTGPLPPTAVLLLIGALALVATRTARSRRRAWARPAPTHDPLL